MLVVVVRGEGEPVELLAEGPHIGPVSCMAPSDPGSSVTGR